MSILQIAPVTRNGMKFIVSFYGLSETGKTLSALLMAAGLEPDPAKRGLMDTEGGERGRMYMDKVPGGYMYGALTPPFSPERYRDGLREFIEAGCTVVVVDSGSHVWDAEGGILELVENSTVKNDMAKWKQPKRRLAKMTGDWKQCGIHIIICSRGKQPYIETVGQDGKKTYVLGDTVPVQEKAIRYDMTLMIHMLGQGAYTIDPARGGKCPGLLQPIFDGKSFIDQEVGKKLSDWLGGKDLTTPHQRALAMAATEEAGAGVDLFRKYYETLPKVDRQYLNSRLDNYLSIARAADDEKKRALQQASDENTDLSDPFGKPVLTGGVQRVGGDVTTDDAPADKYIDAILATTDEAALMKVVNDPAHREVIRTASDDDRKRIQTAMDSARGEFARAA